MRTWCGSPSWCFGDASGWVDGLNVVERADELAGRLVGAVVLDLERAVEDEDELVAGRAEGWNPRLAARHGVVVPGGRDDGDAGRWCGHSCFSSALSSACHSSTSRIVSMIA